ncbi:MAG: ABC transporter ATP-binding protein [Candidatus Alkanophagales archaeon]
MLRVENVSFGYGGARKILEGVSLEVGCGKLVGLLGPNGSGKTTLLRIISKVLEPSGGVVLLDGKRVSELSVRELARELAVVPQETAASFEFTALDVVLMGRTPHLRRFELEREEDLRIAEECMRLTDCWHLADRPITTLSGGERQRVFIARALAQEPKYLLLDEPTANLDLKYKIEIMGIIKRLAVEKKLVVIMASHELNLVASYCDELVLLSNGRIVAAGAVKEVLTRENVRRAFGVDVLVETHPLTGAVYLLPVDGRQHAVSHS